METKHLKNFEVLYESGSIHQAAKKLYITPQGLSKSLQQLEQSLGVKLFDRSRQGVIPTRSAELLHERCGQLLPRFDALERELALLDTPKKRLRLGAANGVFNLVPFRTVTDFRRGHEDILLECGEYSNQEVRDMLRDGRLECGLIVGGWEDADVLTRPVASCPICLLVYRGHPLYDCERVTIDQLRGEPLITMNERFRMYGDFMDACHAHGFAPQILVKTADANLQHKLCREKMGLAIVPAFVQNSFSMEHMQLIPFAEGLNWTVHFAALRSRSDLAALRLFAEQLPKFTPV